MVRGNCEDFCPEQEAKLRIKEKLLHFFEYKNGQRHVPGTLVKSFARSAAGVKAPRAKDLRTERCLRRTIEYLLKDVLMDKRKLYNIVYDFIFDRLRAVRQEIIMQNFDEKQTAALLEPMIMFLAYSRYRLSEETIDNFDPKICDQHLQECLKRVLCCYDNIDCKQLNLTQLHNRNFIESLYQIFNLGSLEALRRALTLPKDTREDKLFKEAFTMAMNYYQGNIYRVLSGVDRLPHILCAIASLKMQYLRRHLYEIFAHGYNNKQLTVPTDFLCRLSCHQRVQDVIADCKYYKLNITEDRKGVHFVKTDFDPNVTLLKSKHEHFVDEKLQMIYLPEVLLLKKLS